MGLGEKIYTLRTEKGMSQTDLAEALEVSRQSISKWETDASVPELDKLIKLSEIFSVSLDELILGRESATVEGKAKPKEQINAPSQTRKIAGTILLCFGAVVWLLITVLGDFFSGLLFSSPFVLCGLVLLLKRRLPGLWCAWVLYLCIDVYLQFATGINLSYAFLPVVYAYSTPVHIIVAWSLVAAFSGLTLATGLCYRKDPMKDTNRNLFYTIGLWVLFFASFLLISLLGKIPITPDIAIYSRLVVAAIGWIRKVLFVASLAVTLRFAYNSRK